MSREHVVGLPRPLRGHPVLEAAWNTHTWFGSMLFWYFGQPAHFKNKAQVLLPVSSGPGLAALDFTWRILLSKELPLQIQIRSLNKWSEVV